MEPSIEQNAGAAYGIARGANILAFFGFVWFGWGFGSVPRFPIAGWLAFYAAVIALGIFAARTLLHAKALAAAAAHHRREQHGDQGDDPEEDPFRPPLVPGGRSAEMTQHPGEAVPAVGLPDPDANAGGQDQAEHENGEAVGDATPASHAAGDVPSEQEGQKQAEGDHDAGADACSELTPP